MVFCLLRLKGENMNDWQCELQQMVKNAYKEKKRAEQQRFTLLTILNVVIILFIVFTVFVNYL